MIENIKRFVNEHHTLIVVIIAVLVISFLYWWFCCKDRLLADKVKGGEICWRVVEVLISPRKSCVMKIVGAKIGDTYFMYALSDAANIYMAKHGLIKNYKLFYNGFIRGDIRIGGSISLKKIIKSPIAFICGLPDNKYIPSLLLCRKENLFDDVYDSNEKGLKSYGEDDTYTKFVFESFLRDYFENYVSESGEEKERKIELHLVVDYYKEFISFVEGEMGDFVHKVVYLGQPSKELDDKRNHFGPDDISKPVEGRYIRYDKSAKGELASDLYNELKIVVRDWYNYGTIKVGIERLYYSNDWEISRASPEVEKKEIDDREQGKIDDDDEKKRSKWQIADIYPAYKMLKMIFLLLAFSTKYKKELNEYMKMIASFIAYIQLFNSFCAAKMWDKWNGSVSNSYVYEYINNNGRGIAGVESMDGPNFDMMARLIGEEVAHTATPDEQLHHFLTGVISSVNKDQKSLVSFEARIQNCEDEEKEIKVLCGEDMYNSTLFLGKVYIDILTFLLDFTEVFDFTTKIGDYINLCKAESETCLVQANNYKNVEKKEAWRRLANAFVEKQNFLIKMGRKVGVNLRLLRKSTLEYGLALSDIINNFDRVIGGHESQDYDDENEVEVFKMGSWFRITINCILEICYGNSVCKNIPYTEELLDGKSRDFEGKRGILMEPYPVLVIDKYREKLEGFGEKKESYSQTFGRESVFLEGSLDFLEHDKDYYMLFIIYLIQVKNINEGDFGFYVLHYMTNLFRKISSEDGWEIKKDRVVQFVSNNEMLLDFYFARAILDLASLLDVFDYSEEAVKKDCMEKLGEIPIVDDSQDEFAWFRDIQEKINGLTKIELLNRKEGSDKDACLSFRKDLENALIKILIENLVVNPMLLIVYVGMQLNENLTYLFEPNYEVLRSDSGGTTKLELGTECKQLLEEMKKIHVELLTFIDGDPNMEENFQNLARTFNDQKTFENVDKTKLFFYLINDISLYKPRNSQFWSKIERILKSYEKQIKEKFKNDELFEIFKYNKRLLLFLFEEKFVAMNQNIFLWLMYRDDDTNRLVDYFAPELNTICVIKEIPEGYSEKRKEGENDNSVCELIRGDEIDDFIGYINKNEINVNSLVEQSVFETNDLLLNKDISYIQYAAFFGSFQILKYLLSQGAKADYVDLLEIAVHGNNAEMIEFLIEKMRKPSVEELLEITKMAIKCHQIEIFNKFSGDLPDKLKENEMVELGVCILRYHNFNLITDDLRLDSSLIFFILNEFCYNCFIKDIIKQKDCGLGNIPNLLQMIPYIIKYRGNNPEIKPDYGLLTVNHPKWIYTFDHRHYYEHHPPYFLNEHSDIITPNDQELQPTQPTISTISTKLTLLSFNGINSTQQFTGEEWGNVLVEVVDNSTNSPSGNKIDRYEFGSVKITLKGEKGVKLKWEKPDGDYATKTIFLNEKKYINIKDLESGVMIYGICYKQNSE